jgi:hypothetical protein
MPAIPIPLNQPPKEILLALLNRDNNSSFTLTQIDFDSVTPMPPGFARNTRVRVFALPGGGFSTSEKLVYFNRLDLAYQWRNTVPVSAVETPANTLDILPGLNSLYNINITSADVISTSFTTSPHTVTASPSSLVWIGSVAVSVIPPGSSNELLLEEEFQDATPLNMVYNSGNNYNKTTSVLMYELLTQMTGSSMVYVEESFTLSPLTSITTETVGITLTAVNGSGFSGLHYRTYNRFNLSSLITSLSIPMSVFTGGGYSIGSLIPGSFIRSYINTTFNTGFISGDLTIPDFVLSLGGTVTVTSTLMNYLTHSSVTMTVVS